jgi:pimeloyl-ACP methyl ester carboxylesterase
MSTVVYLIAGTAGAYLLLTLYLTYLVQHIPRQPVVETPDWGTVCDTRIAAVDGGQLEVWRIEPDRPARGTVVLAHGWGRNRDRMVPRARILGRWGFETVIHSARDHGGSSPKHFMNAVKFAEDIESVLKWLNQPVVLYGHSLGAGGAAIAASRNPDYVRLLILEASYAYTKEALRSLYRWVNPLFGGLFAPMIVFWMDLFYRGQVDAVSPARLAPAIQVPVLIIHGENDRRFPLRFASTLKENFKPGLAELYVAKGAGHSDSSQTSGYQPCLKAFLDRHYPP